jgi:hypothetical protein
MAAYNGKWRTLTSAKQAILVSQSSIAAICNGWHKRAAKYNGVAVFNSRKALHLLL